MQAKDELSILKYDQLTGVYSRWQNYVELQNVIDIGKNRVYGTIDIDGFKLINEQYGSPVGDSLLKVVAKTLQEVYPDALIFRISGDEFAFLLPEVEGNRYNMCVMTRELFDKLNSISVSEVGHMRLAFSIGTVYIEPEIYTTPDAIYLEARTQRLAAKKHEGIFLTSIQGSIPDVAGVFMILQEDRQLYNNINNRLFRIHDESDWIAYLKEGALLKSDMYLRNQSQIDDILDYYRDGELPECEYELLSQLVIQSGRILDAFMTRMFIEDILLPYYMRCDINDISVRSRLGHLSLLLAHNLIAVLRMGDLSVKSRIKELLKLSCSVSRDLRHDTIQFEPYFFALCEIVGHFECLSMQLFSVEECDEYYEEFRNLLIGPDPIVFQDQEIFNYFENLINNARLFPLYRACYLRLFGNMKDDGGNKEYERRLDYIRQHIVDGVYDMAGDNPEYRNMSMFLQELLLNDISVDETLSRLQNALREIRNIGYGTSSQSNIVVVAYLFLASSRIIEVSTLAVGKKRAIGIVGVNFLIELLRKREAIATDHQMLLLTHLLLRAMVSTTVLSPSDKLYYLGHMMEAVMLDTYSHSKAVAAYAKVILSNIIDNYPQLLVGEGRPYNNVDEVRANREPLLEFMETACLLHDIGKMNISPITGNAYRRLTDREFALIRKHPEAGADILSLEPAFAPFRPFVLNHHLWWDGTSGYPEPDVNAPVCNVKVLVDILSICDSLEAATSRIGRNYRHNKTFLQIFDEFYTEAGSRYSKEILNTIIGSPDTYYHIRQMVDVHWQDIYRSIFQHIIAESKAEEGPSPSAQLPDMYRNTPTASAEDSSPDSLVKHLDLPIWLRDLDRDTLLLYAFTLIERNRQAATHADLNVFFYDVTSDTMGVLGAGPDGKVAYHFAPHFLERPLGIFVSSDSYHQIVEIMKMVINVPDYPKEGQRKFENLDRTRSIIATYTSVVDNLGRVLTIVGHLEESNSSRSRLLQAIKRQNSFIEMLNPIIDVYNVAVYTDIKLEKFTLLKGFPILVEAASRFSNTQEVIDFTRTQLIDEEYQDAFAEFCNPDTVVERLKGRQRISIEYHSRVSGWLMAHLIPATYDANGNLTHMVFCNECIDDEHSQRASLSFAAHHDALTGLYNRMKGEELIREGITQGGSQIFAIYDCDKFKSINDQLSHLIGDSVLRSFGTVLNEFFSDDIAMRLGGDEFVVYIGGTTATRLLNSYNGVKNLFDKMAQKISTIRLPELENIPPTFSCGIAISDGSLSDLTFEDFYQVADEALRVSKQRRNGTITLSVLNIHNPIRK